MNGPPENIRRRPPSKKKLRVSCEEKMEKVVHKEVEKQRRLEMASLYASLRSLLPLEFIQGKRSTSDQLNGGVNYIEYLERNIKDMSSKRDGLVLLSRRSFGSSNEQGCDDDSNHVVIRPCLVGVEIVFSHLQTPISSVLQVLRERGLCVIGCISSSVNDRLIHTLQAEVKDLALIDLADLKVTLTLIK
ncbi:transcription factor bHLH118 [Capsella rubella]|uniref:transcription factor bHLH118 n=1 Tax=Capsella rubella TaxID=81985 RepID=UPI000CD4E676|nr:transcription factor bHLH118 [Capsella rubella]